MFLSPGRHTHPQRTLSPLVRASTFLTLRRLYLLPPFGPAVYHAHRLLPTDLH